jgi:hypothetical protein
MRPFRTASGHKPCNSDSVDTTEGKRLHHAANNPQPETKRHVNIIQAHVRKKRPFTGRQQTLQQFTNASISQGIQMADAAYVAMAPSQSPPPPATLNTRDIQARILARYATEVCHVAMPVVSAHSESLFPVPWPTGKQQYGSCR